jgi:excisionase family DNA binding protein
MDRPVLTLEETARLLGLSVKIIRREIKAGNIKAIKIGRKTLVLRAPLEKQLVADDRRD